MVGKTGVFICPACQAAVKGSPDQEGGLVCPECNHRFGGPVGKKPPSQASPVPLGRSAGKSASVVRNLTARKGPPVKSVGVAPPVVEAKRIEQVRAENQGHRGEGEILMPDGTRRVRRRRRKKKDEHNKGLVLFLLGWLSLIVIILAIFKLGGDDEVGEDQAGPEKLENEDETRNNALMQRLLPKIGRQFQDFLRQQTNDRRGQYIDRSSELSFAFSQFYNEEVFPKPDSSPKLVDKNVITFADSNIAIETIWKDAEDHLWGAVHVFDKLESWKLDWECFAPYSTESWTRFRANLGPKSGIFRLLVRKRQLTSSKDKFTLTFYRAPKVFETDNEYKNTQSPEVDVEVDSKVGKKFLKAWEDFQEGKSPYGSILGKYLDPRGHLRVTVELEWTQNELGEEVIVLKDLIGVGWFGERIQKYHEERVAEITEEAEEKIAEDPDGEPLSETNEGNE